MRYLRASLAIAMCVVQAKAAAVTIRGLPYPLAPQGMRWIGSVTPGSRNVTLYGTVDKIKSQIDDLKLRPEEEWPLSTEAEEKSVLNGITLDATGVTKRSFDHIDCNNAIGSAFPLNAIEIIEAIATLPGTCGSSANTCTLMNSKGCSGIYFCTTAGVDISTGCYGAGLAGSTVMSCITTDYSEVKGTGFDNRGWAIIIQNSC